MTADRWIEEAEAMKDKLIEAFDNGESWVNSKTGEELKTGMIIEILDEFIDEYTW